MRSNQPKNPKAIKVMDSYPLLPDVVLQQSRLPMKSQGPPMDSQSLSAARKSWDFIHQTSDSHRAPVRPHSAGTCATADAEVRQRVISELARRLHSVVNQRVAQKRAALEGAQRLNRMSVPTELPPSTAAKPVGSTTLEGLGLTVSGPKDTALESLSLEELMKRVIPNYGSGQCASESAPGLALVLKEHTAFSGELKPETGKETKRVTMASTSPPAVPVEASTLALDAPEPEQSTVCPMAQVSRVSSAPPSEKPEAARTSNSQSAAASPPVVLPALQSLAKQMELKKRAMMREDTGLVRITRLKGVSTFNRGIFALTKRTRRGRLVGPDDGERVPSSSKEMMEKDALQQWLCSFLPDELPEEEGLDVPTPYSVLRDLSTGLEGNMNAKWKLESLTKAARAKLNARHSRYMICTDDSYSNLIGSISAVVQARYGSNLSEEEKELAKKRLRQMREKEKEQATMLPYIRNEFTPKSNEMHWKRPDSAVTAVFTERSSGKLPVGAKYVPGVGFVDSQGRQIEMSTEEEEELRSLLKKLQESNPQMGALTPEDLDLMDQMRDPILGKITSSAEDLASGMLESPSVTVQSIGMGQTLTMQEAEYLRGPSASADAVADDARKEVDDERPLCIPSSFSTERSNSTNSSSRWENRSLSTAEDNATLDLFLAHFPESKKHVQLRKEANAVLNRLEPLATNGNFSFFDNPFSNSLPDFAGRASRTESPLHFDSSQGSMPSYTTEPPVRGFFLEENMLRERFIHEAENRNKALTAERNRLRAEVEKQRTTLNTFSRDIEFLSFGDGERSSDEYAADLTRDVNAYAKTHNLTLNELELTKEAERHLQACSDVGRGFLAQFSAGRASSKAVACQVTEEDLGYVDETVRLAEEQMEDLLFHERAILDSIRLATIAVANVMSFHASLELESTCKECFYLYEQPRTLWPCGHTFCQQCLTSMYNANDELICAECGSVCDVGYTPNLSIEVVAKYQVVQETDEKAIGKRNKKLTLEGVLRRLLSDLLSTQKNCRNSTGPAPSLKERVNSYDESR